jgi:hypothetical protein
MAKTEELEKKEPKVKKPVYNPQGKYNWKEGDIFPVSGKEFGLLINAFRAVLSTREAQTILLVERANEVIENLLATSVENGIATEVKNETKEQ